MIRQRLPHPAVFLPWLLAALSLLWLKRDLLIEFPIHNAIQTSPELTTTFLNNLACYRLDILLLFGVIPLLAALVFSFIPRFLHLPLMAIACSIIEMLVYAEGRSLMLIGQFSSFDLFKSAISWGSNGTAAQDYIPVSGIIKLVLSVFLVVAMTFGASRIVRSDLRKNLSMRRQTVTLYLAIVVLLSGACFVIPVPPTALTTSVATVLFESFFGLEPVDNRTNGLQNLTMDELIVKYRQLAHAPFSEKDPEYFACARNKNVIFLIWETGPARYFDMAGDLDQFPNLARLREHAIVSRAHYSTYPYTNRAHLSIFTSLYPYAKKNFQAFPHKTLPGVISTLRAQGYQTGVYGHLWTGESDANMYHSIGFTKIAVPTGGIDNGNVPWRQKIQIDKGALSMLEADAIRWNSQNQHFAVAFLPNIGHGPWPDMSNDNDRQTIPERGRALMGLEDQWLGELISVLEQNHMLSNTIIVLTSDHGVRDKVDDPAFNIGTIDAYSYHVPLMIYCPTLSNRVDIPWLTSHIDIAPTVLDLLGIDENRDFEEGAPIWQENLRNRTTFFLASHYMGADAYVKENTFYMVKYLSGSAFESPQLHFDGEPLPDGQADRVKELTRQLNAIQAAMFYKFAYEMQKPNH